MTNSTLAEVVDQATRALKANYLSDAANALKRAVDLAPDDGNLWLWYGTVCGRVHENRRATEALLKAADLMPDDPRPYSNLAVHMYHNGPRVMALNYAEEALSRDPFDEQAQAVANRLKAPNDIVLALAGREPFWTRYGWVIVGVSLVVMVLLASFPPVHAPAGRMDSPLDLDLRTDPFSFGLIVAWIATGLMAMGWMIFDMLYRRTRFTWLAPILIGSVTGAVWLPLAFYLGVGRRYTGKIDRSR